MREKEYPFLLRPVARAALQCRCLIAHFEIRRGWQVQRFPCSEVPRRVRPVPARGSILIMMAETAEELRKRPEIRKELERATGEKHREKIQPPDRDRFWFVAYAVALAICAVSYFLVSAKLIPLPQAGLDISKRILRGAVLITIVLAAARAMSVYGIARIEDASTRFTLQRIAHLVVGLAVALIVVSR